MWNFSLGPNSPIPGDRLRVGIIDAEGKVVRRFEQIRGVCTDPGWVDFFNSPRCHAAEHQYPIVDFDENGQVASILCEHYTQSMGMDLYLSLLETWVRAHGKEAWAL